MVQERAIQTARATTSPEMAGAHRFKPAMWPNPANEHELTCKAASELLHVSLTHPYAVADAGVLGLVRLTKDGHRLLPKAGVLSFRTERRRRQARGLRAAMAAAQKLGLHDAALAELPLPLSSKR